MSLPVVVNIERVPVDEERQPLVTEPVFTILVAPQQTAQVLRFIGRTLPPLTGIEHVKRVKKSNNNLLIVMCQCSRLTRADLDSVLKGSEWAALPVAVHSVPTTAPYTSAQYAKWKDVWPVSFRPPVHLRMVLSPDDREYIETNIRRIARAMGGEQSVAICNGRTHQVVAEMSVSDNERQPLKHAAMCCIAEVARTEKQRQEKESSPPAKRCHSPDDAAGYLCEGLDVFASREPCVMCAMALVHSRIGRLFFLTPTAAGGGITRYSLHSLKGLNHHYTAFQCTVN